MRNDEIATKADMLELKQELFRIKQLVQESTQNTPKDEYLRSAEVQKMLGICPSTLQNYREQRILPFHKVRGTIFFNKKDVLKVIEKGRQDFTE